MFRPTCDNHIPVRPPDKKKKKKATNHKKGRRTIRNPFSTVRVQLTTLTIAGREIITVIVLYIDLARWSRPTRYIWWPQTRNPM